MSKWFSQAGIDIRMKTNLQIFRKSIFGGHFIVNCQARRGLFGPGGVLLPEQKPLSASYI